MAGARGASHSRQGVGQRLPRRRRPAGATSRADGWCAGRRPVAAAGARAGEGILPPDHFYLLLGNGGGAAAAAACFDAGVAALLPLRPRMSQLTTTQSLTMLRSLAGSMRLLVSPERRAQAPSAVKQVVPEIEALAGLLAALLRAHAPLRPLLTEPAPHMDWPGWAAGRSALVAAMPLRARQLEASLQPVDDAIAGRPAAAAAPAKGSAAKAAPAAPASTAATAAVRVRTEEQAAAAAAALLEVLPTIRRFLCVRFQNFGFERSGNDSLTITTMTRKTSVNCPNGWVAYGQSMAMGDD